MDPHPYLFPPIRILIYIIYKKSFRLHYTTFNSWYTIMLVRYLWALVVLFLERHMCLGSNLLQNIVFDIVISFGWFPRKKNVDFKLEIDLLDRLFTKIMKDNRSSCSSGLYLGCCQAVLRGTANTNMGSQAGGQAARGADMQAGLDHPCLTC